MLPGRRRRGLCTYLYHKHQDRLDVARLRVIAKVPMAIGVYGDLTAAMFSEMQSLCGAADFEACRLESSGTPGVDGKAACLIWRQRSPDDQRTMGSSCLDLE